MRDLVNINWNVMIAPKRICVKLDEHSVPKSKSTLKKDTDANKNPKKYKGKPSNSNFAEHLVTIGHNLDPDRGI